MTDEIYETPTTTPNFRTELAAQLAELVPEAIADGKVDVEKLKELLDDDVADGVERFGLFWPGKKRAMRAAQEPTTATLKPDFENSKDWDTTKNVFIEGDNLEVLKILQKHYHAKIKLIYIDPPYNTGKDFVYPDNYKEGLDTYLEWTRQVNEEGKKVTTNAETEGRYHSNWLNMMYPRLKLARNLLTDDGVIFISIDDHEYDNLLRLAKEVFGESSYLGTIAWLKKRKGSFLSKGIVSMHEYAVAFGRRPGARLFGGRADASESQPLVKRTNPRSVLRFPAGVSTRLPDGTIQAGVYGEGTSSVKLLNQIRISGGVIVDEFALEGPFVWSQAYLDEQLSDGGRIVMNTMNLQPRAFKAPSEGNVKGLSSVFNGVAMSATNEDAYEHASELFGQEGILDYPKPVNYLKALLEACTSLQKSGIVLDFFAGSGTLAESVMRLNAEDGGDRKWIQVQLPEPTPDGSQARKAGFRSIADIARARVALAADRVVEEFAGQLRLRDAPLDTGFRAYRLADTSFSKWRISSDVEEDALQQHLLSLRDSATDDATADDLLTEILLKQGYSLTEAVSPAEVAGLDVRLVRDTDGDVAVVAYLNEHVKPTLEQFRALVDESPTRIIVLEDAFQGDDELKTNLAQLCKSKGIELWTA